MDFKIVGRIKDIEVIAKGTAIRERKRLWKSYGKGRWRKLKGNATILGWYDVPGRDSLYEAHGIGAKEHKIKRIIG